MKNYGFPQWGRIVPAFLLLGCSLNLQAAPASAEEGRITGMGLVQQRPIAGRVTDAEGNASAGATVTLQGASQVVTADGTRRCQVTPPQQGLDMVFTMVGLGPVEQRIGDPTTFALTMQPATGILDEVVVGGYGTMKRRDLVGAVEQVGI